MVKKWILPIQESNVKCLPADIILQEITVPLKSLKFRTKMLQHPETPTATHLYLEECKKHLQWR